jgi:exo-beta-1,3-glucanase (GH17 family)
VPGCENALAADRAPRLEYDLIPRMSIKGSDRAELQILKEYSVTIKLSGHPAVDVLQLRSAHSSIRVFILIFEQDDISRTLDSQIARNSASF